MSMSQSRNGSKTKLCPTCGDSFQTYKSEDKKYCSAKCYFGSEVFKQTRERYSAEAEKARVEITCAQCGAAILVRPGLLSIRRTTERGRTLSHRRRFCNRSCYRKHMSDKASRLGKTKVTVDLKGLSWDEFLLQDSLPCVVKGCPWVGDHLGIHVAHAHNISAPELKEMLGFNRNSGLMSRPSWLDRRSLSIEQGIGREDMGALSVKGNRDWELRPEGRQHLAIAQAICRIKREE